MNPESFNCRIQDKVANKSNYHLRSLGGHPYNPDTVDILQITQIDKKAVYAIPFRAVKKGAIVSHFTKYELMHKTIRLSKQWREDYARFRHELATEAGAKAYVTVCEAAAAVPPLTDQQFYSSMLTEYSHNFGSKKQREIKQLAKELEAADSGEAELSVDPLVQIRHNVNIFHDLVDIMFGDVIFR